MEKESLLKSVKARHEKLEKETNDIVSKIANIDKTI